MSRIIFGALVLIFVVTIQTASALQCWKCSSDIDPTCNDHFNQTEILERRGGRQYDSYNQRQPPYDPNYNPSYNPGFNPNFNNLNGQTPALEQCDNNEATLRRMKNVCLKKTIKGPGNYVSIVRRCAMINPNEEVGTCHDPVSRGLNLEFCEYCDNDRCNSATELKMNIFLTSLAATILILWFKH